MRREVGEVGESGTVDKIGGETPKQHSDALSTGLIHKIVLTIWAVGPLIAFPFALHRAVKTRRIGKKVVITTIIGYLLTGQTTGSAPSTTRDNSQVRGLPSNPSATA